MSLLQNTVIPLLFVSTTFAQWSDLPSVNLPICSAVGEQAQPKIVLTSDGGSFISWLDNRLGGYDVYMQRLDASGTALWQSDGILIADRSYSSTMDYGLTVDNFGNAVVTYRKNVLGVDGIAVTSITGSGVIRWTTTVQLGGAFVASPVITAVGNDVVVGWISDEFSKFQRLNVKGIPLWPQPTIVNDPGTMLVSDLHPSADGSVIASFVQYASFLGSKQLRAQRIGIDGSLLWVNPVSVMTSNSLQFGSFPDFVPDGSGGGFFTWYGVGPLQVYAAHVLVDGSQGYIGGTVQVASSFGGTERVSPIGVRDGNEFVVFLRTLDNNQGNDGIAAQRLDVNGNILWGTEGVTIKPTSSVPQYSSFAAAKSDQGVALFFVESASFGISVLNGISLDQFGAMQWTPGVASVSSNSAGKFRVLAASELEAGIGGGIVLAWQDDQGGTYDIYGQRVNGDGTLGGAAICIGDVDGDGFVGVTDVLAAIGTWGTCPLTGECIADLNNDGFVDVVDLLTIIGVWGSCP